MLVVGVTYSWPNNYVCGHICPLLQLNSLAEGILEDSVVEGIDRKDVFFYQVRKHS